MSWSRLVVLIALSAQDASSPRELAVDAWIDATIDAATPAIEGTGLAGADAAPARGLRFALGRDRAGPLTIEARAAWFDAALAIRDKTGALIATDDDGWYGVHPAITLAADEAARAASVDVIALHGGMGAFAVRLRAGTKEVLDADALARRVLEDANAQVQEVQAHPERTTSARIADLRRTTAVLRDAGLGEDARRVAALAVAGAERTNGQDLRDALCTLGLLQNAAGRFDAAFAAFSRAHELAVAEFGAGDPRAADYVRLVALPDIAQGRFDEARDRLEQAVAVLERTVGKEHLDTLAALEPLGQVYAQQGDSDRAAAAFTRILEGRAQRLGEDDSRTIDAMHNLGSTLYGAGDLQRARALLERALAATERIAGADHPDVALTARELGGVLYQLGDYRAAKPLAERAYSIFERVYGPENTATAGALRDRALIAEVMGDPEDARIWFQRCVDVRAKLLGADHPDLAADRATLAGLLSRNGAAAAAKPLIERALASHVAVLGPEHATVAADHLIAAEIEIRLGNVAAAHEHTRTALALREAALGKDHYLVAHALSMLGVVLGYLGRAEEARDAHERALAIDLATVGETHGSTLATMNDLALAEHDLGNCERALELLQRAMAAGDRTPDRVELERASSLQNAALVEVDLGQGAAALRDSRRALDIAATALDAMRQKGSEGHRLAHLRRLRSHLGEFLAITGLEPGHEREAYEAVLRWKITAFAAARGGESAAIGPERRDSLRALHAELADAAYADASQDAWARDERLARARDAVASAESEWTQAAVATAPRPTLVDVAAALPPGAALLDLVIHDDYRRSHAGATGRARRGQHLAPVVTAFVLRGGAASPLRVELGSAAAIGSRLSIARDMLAADVDAADTAGALRDLGRAVFDPLADALADATSVFVVPDDFLGTIPWDALTALNGRFLVESLTISVLHDPSRLLELARTPAALDKSLLCVGGVDYDGALAADSARTGRPSGFAPLPGTLVEARTVFARFKAIAGAEASATLLDGRAATKDAVAAAAPGAHVIHLATHGFFQPTGLKAMWERADTDSRMRMRDEPNAAIDLVPSLLSGLAFAGANAPPAAHRASGLLTAAEAAWLPLADCDLVVLSACSTARGRSAGSESLASVQRAFHLAGARSVVSTLWDVDDVNTAAWMNAFYAALWERRESPANAVRAAKLEMLAAQRGRERLDPAAWAGFVLSQ